MNITIHLYDNINIFSGTKCVQFELYGVCGNGLSCLFGDSHIDKDNGKSIINPTGKIRLEINQLSQETKNLLRKKKYDFSAPKKITAESSFDSSPYPLKEVKLVDFSNKVYVAPLTTVGEYLIYFLLIFLTFSPYFSLLFIIYLNLRQSSFSSYFERLWR